jgi:hypothetical protein
MARTFAATQYLTRSSTPVTVVPLSIACWFNATNFTGGPELIILQDSSTAANNDFTITLTTGGALSAETGQSGSYDEATTTTSASTAVWNHAAGSWASITSRNAQLNAGGKTATTVSKTPASISTTYVATYGAGTGGQFVGSIAWVAIWKVALSDSDIASLNKGFSPLKIQPSQLVSYVRLTGNASPEPDYKGGSWTITGSPTKSNSPRQYAP